MWRDMADLAGDDLETSAVERLPKRHRHLARAIPAQFDDLRLETGERQSCHKPCAMPRRMEDTVKIIFQSRCFRQSAKLRAESLRPCGFRLIDIDECEVDGRHARDDRRDERADDTRTNDRDLVARTNPGIPYGIERGFEVGGQGCALGRNTVRYRCQGGDRHHEPILMRVEDEGTTPDPLSWAILDNTNSRIAIFDGKGEVARLLRRAHAVEFRWRNFAS